MSKYHKDCCKKDGQTAKPPKPTGSDTKPPKTILNSKAFCDCNRCTSEECPDILKLLSITVSDTTCHFGSQIESGTASISKSDAPLPPEILTIIENEDRDCACEIVARSFREDLHTRFGMSDIRDKIQANFEGDNSNEQLEAEPATDPDSPESSIESIDQFGVQITDSRAAKKTDEERPTCPTNNNNSCCH